ncbi:hypothetical protein [Mesorhizobium amorphae]|uniref:hypothetical protein n=1 Tax=Mesorhizobium amorphae TaxID=71433 RepID=UPI0011822578|nr:hypothetical protein [Mesorhizobium amorphae]
MSQEREGLFYITDNEQFSLSLTDDDKRDLLTASKQIEVLEALNSYANALSQAADKGVTAELASAASTLATSTSGLVSAASPTSAAIIEPAGKFAGDLAGIALKNQYALKIRQIVRNVDPFVQRIAEQMPAALAEIIDGTRHQVENYQVSRGLTLAELRSDRRSTRLDLYREYLLARADVDGAWTLQTALENSAGIFAKLAAAHKALAENAPNSEAAIQDFATVANDLAALIKAVREARASK